MLFNTYQYLTSTITQRGYSKSSIINNENGERFWAKWILGIDKNATKAKILTDRLRHIQKARHLVLPDIIHYGYDEEQNAFAIIYKLLKDVNTLEDCVHRFPLGTILNGLTEIVDCLQELHTKYKISHGDIHPANILVDSNGQFYLVDFGLANITRTLSQEKDLEIFAGSFAAPEKMNKTGAHGFAYQADIFSLGKVIEWLYHEKYESLSEESSRFLTAMTAAIPAERPEWPPVKNNLVKFTPTGLGGLIAVSFKESGNELLILELLNRSTPIFDLSPNAGENYLMDIIVGDYILEGVLWLKNDKRIQVKKVKSLESIEPEFRGRKLQYGKKLPVKFSFLLGQVSTADPTPYFDKWFRQQQQEKKLRDLRKAGKEELNFYKDLLDEELKQISKKSLQLQYSNFRLKGNDEIEFIISENPKLSSIGQVHKHIDEGNDITSDSIEYETSSIADKKQNKKPILFTGKPYRYDSKNRVLSIKDCDHLKKDEIPQRGFLFESTRKKEEEKRRQKEAIRCVEKSDVQNPDLIHYLFNPNGLPELGYSEHELTNVQQKDKKGNALKYSYNQEKAILNAIHKNPLTVIQGPPGTGKTTVITEIVFQILALKPESKILITSQTNNAVDQVLENLIKNHIPVVRLTGLSEPRIQAVKAHTLNRKLEGWKQLVTRKAKEQFLQRKKSVFESWQSKTPIAVSLAEIIFGDFKWEQIQIELKKIAERISNLKSLLPIPTDRGLLLEKADKLLGTEMTDFEKLFNLHKNWVSTVNALDEKSAINQKLIDSIRLVGATCNHIAAKKYSKYNFEFDYVIMDESGKATTAEALVPIILGKNLVFVGDHRQLRPRLTSSRDVEKWLRNKFKIKGDELESWEDYFNRPSLFEQVICKIDADYKAQLTECRRSSKDQVMLTSKCFYEAENDEAIEYVDRLPDEEHNLSLAVNSSIFFIDIGHEYKNERDQKTRSSSNKKSAEIIAQLLTELNKYEKVSSYSIGVITGYAAQHRVINEQLYRNNLLKGLTNIRQWKIASEKETKGEKLTVSVIDRFQGLERDIIVLDLVKSGAGLDLGFLEIPNRINVALSRQKKLLFIVGDYAGIVNARTRKEGGEKAALQHYLELVKEEWIVKEQNLKSLFR
jgi:superfamily I DNA and/or RNA helicase/tRNA A-37 threonylcarbamoyl transferase component Bud32